METLEPVTPEANPAEDEQPVVDPEDQQVETPPAPKPPVQPDAAYKGLQRTLEREKARVRELEAQIAQAGNQGLDEQSATVIKALIQEIARHDPERGQQMLAEFDRLQLVQENTVLRNQSEAQRREQQLQAIEERNVEELRAVVSSIGADPDSPEIDYGTSNEWFAERLKRARVTAQEVAMAEKPVVRSKADGTSHNTQPAGQPAAPIRSNTRTVTQEDLLKAQRKYSVDYQSLDPAKRAAAEAELRALNDAFAKQAFAT